MTAHEESVLLMKVRRKFISEYFFSLVGNLDATELWK